MNRATDEEIRMRKLLLVLGMAIALVGRADAEWNEGMVNGNLVKWTDFNGREHMHFTPTQDNAGEMLYCLQTNEGIRMLKTRKVIEGCMRELGNEKICAEIGLRKMEAFPFSEVWDDCKEAADDPERDQFQWSEEKVIERWKKNHKWCCDEERRGKARQLLQVE